jgi:hypothetical protein
VLVKGLSTKINNFASKDYSVFFLFKIKTARIFAKPSAQIQKL